MPLKLEQRIVEQWVDIVKGQFTTREIWDELDITSAQNKHHLRTILYRLEEKRVIVSVGRGVFRKVDNEAPIIDWQQADVTNTVPLRFPFGLEEHAKIFPKSIIVVTGSKNAGKTAFLYNFIQMNMGLHIIDLYNTETGPEQMKERFEPLDIPYPAPFNVYERYDNFADVIHPDHISVIDYLDMQSEVYWVGSEIDALFRRTNNVVVIGLQKPPPSITYVKGVKKVIDRDLGYGGGFSAKRSVLYISMSEHKLKLVYVKTPANPKINPNNRQWTFGINGDGIHFVDVQPFQGDNDY